MERETKSLTHIVEIISSEPKKVPTSVSDTEIFDAIKTADRNMINMNGADTQTTKYGSKETEIFLENNVNTAAERDAIVNDANTVCDQAEKAEMRSNVISPRIGQTNTAVINQAFNFLALEEAASEDCSVELVRVPPEGCESARGIGCASGTSNDNDISPDEAPPVSICLRANMEIDGCESENEATVGTHVTSINISHNKKPKKNPGTKVMENKCRNESNVIVTEENQNISSEITDVVAKSTRTQNNTIGIVGTDTHSQNEGSNSVAATETSCENSSLTDHATGNERVISPIKESSNTPENPDQRNCESVTNEIENSETSIKETEKEDLAGAAKHQLDNSNILGVPGKSENQCQETEESVTSQNLEESVTSQNPEESVTSQNPEESAGPEKSETSKNDADGEEEIPVIRRRQSGRRKKSEAKDADISDDSSDEDSGIYAESHRNSRWIQVVEENDEDGIGDMKTSTSHRAMSDQLPATGKILRMDSGEDAVFTEGFQTLPKANHRRSESTSTTLSENEFKRQRSYKSRRRCLIQRQESQQEYHRLSAKVYDQEKLIVVEKLDKDTDFGLHILDSHPAFITSVDPGSPAERCGVREGQIVISVNGVNTLELSHNEIVQLVQKYEKMVRIEVAYSDFQPVRDLEKPVMAGFMMKLGMSTLMKMWKKRYFVLRQDNCLYYYKNQQEMDPLGAIPLSGYCISRYIDTSKDYCFKAEKYGAKTYYFMTDSREEMTLWVGVLTEAASRCKQRKDSWLEVSSHNVGLPALEIRRPECTGLLTKLGQQHKTWQKRYCVLKDACIYYYKSMSSLSAKGVVHLHGYTVDSTGSGNKKFSFVLHPPCKNMRTFYFCADNQTDKQRSYFLLFYLFFFFYLLCREAGSQNPKLEIREVIVTI